MKNYSKKMKLIDFWRGNCSVYGNPSYFVVLEDENSNIYHGKTASNASCGYSISNYNDKQYHDFKYHYTKNDNMIIDYIK